MTEMIRFVRRIATSSEIRHSSFGNSSFHAMSGPAQVRSTEAIGTVALALARFEQRVQSALDALDAEIRRAGEWVEHDRPAHWKNQLHLAEDGVHDAKIELERCLTYNVSTQERPACREQKAALEKAKARLEYCREKADAVKHWQRNFRHESFEYDGRVGQLRRVVEQDVPLARGSLAKIMRRLEEYRVENAPAAFNEIAAEPAAPATYAQWPKAPAATADADSEDQPTTDADDATL
jgi:hypothetical protein